MDASTWTQALGVVLPVLYFAAAFLYGMHFGGPAAPRVARARTLAVTTALLVHAGLFAAHALHSRAFPAWEPWTNTSAVALGLALLYLSTRLRIQDEGAGVLVFLIVAVLQLFASALGPLAPRDPGAPFEFVRFCHALTSTLAGSALLLSGLHGAMYMFVLRRMRRGSFGLVVERLPDLRTLALLTRRAALAGFLLLTLGVNLGIGWAHASDNPGFSYSDQWVIAMIALWLHFGLVAFSRSIPGFSADRASFAATLGLTVFLAAGVIATVGSSFHWQG